MAKGFWRERRVLITGGAGFIGSNLAIRLVAEGASVVIADAYLPEQGANPRNLAPLAGKVRVVVGDLRRRSLSDALVDGCDAVFNLAGQTSHLDSMADPFPDLASNCEAQLAVLEACRKRNPLARIVFASTRQVYGRPLRQPVDEAHPTAPVDLNGVHKLAAEDYHRLYHEVHGLPTCRLRLTNTIGPRMRIRDARQTFLGIWIRRLLEGGVFEVWGGAQKRDFNDVDDVVEALLLAGEKEAAVGRVFNLGSSESIALLQLAELLVSLHGRGAFRVREFPSDRAKIDIGDYQGDHTAITAALGWKPLVPLRETLRRTLAYFKAELPGYV